MATPKQVVELVERFLGNRDSYIGARYNETQNRREFIDPFFKCLGWDIDNTAGYAEAYKDVVHEDILKIGDSTKAPDYSFRVGGVRKFFLEAKKPSINVRDATEPAYQLRRYAWSAKLPISVLSNFAELAIYDCRIKPAYSEKASTARVKYYRCEEYLEKWDEIEAILSKDAIYKGSFDKFVLSDRIKKGTSTVDDEFLVEIETWREALARNIALRNRTISQRQLNYCVQQTIDRIIFLRICEDRGIENYGRLRGLLDGRNTYEQLKHFYRQADDRYNSGLFHFRKEPGRSMPPDEFSLAVSIDDKVLKDIVRRLYYPESPYEFSVLPADILGQVYEQFLGKIIVVHSGHTHVEDKPDLKKAGGVYYTPAYVVEYIVRSTLAPRLVDRTLKTIRGLSILDPACGSGSFLIVAYQRLLDWYLSKYVEEDIEKHSKGRNAKIFKGSSNEWRLTTNERKRILVDHIYGVDIDPQAVEVTKLSLLLKVLERESAETLHKNLELFHERALPDLEANIKCGNSLIGPDFYEHKFNFDDEQRYRINAFSWQEEFSAILKRGGFDIVIGNPPYRRELDYKILMDEIASTAFGARYRSPRMDLWYYFVHRGLELLNDGGSLSFIVNSYWMLGTGAEKLILALREGAHIDEIFLLGKLQVFRPVQGQHMIFRITKGQYKTPCVIRVTTDQSAVAAEACVVRGEHVKQFTKQAEELYRARKIDVQEPNGSLLDKIERHPPLQSYGVIRQGIAENPAAINHKTNAKFGGRWTVGEGVFVLSPSELKSIRLPAAEKDLIRPYHELRDLGRYFVRQPPSAFIIYSSRYTCPDIASYPTIRSHLRRFRTIMEQRRETKDDSNSWWHLHWPRDEALWRSPKILSVQMGARPAFVPVVNPTYVSFSVNVFVPRDNSEDNLFFITAILNSKLMWKWFKHHAKSRGLGLEINGHVLEQVPVAMLDTNDETKRKVYERLIILVRRMLETQGKMNSGASGHEAAVLKRVVQSTEHEIDQLVYGIYELSEDEIASVESEIVS